MTTSLSNSRAAKQFCQSRSACYLKALKSFCISSVASGLWNELPAGVLTFEVLGTDRTTPQVDLNVTKCNAASLPVAIQFEFAS